MISNKNLVFILLIFLGSTSCKKDFLDVQDNSAILRQQYVKDLNTTNDFLNGIYVLLGRDFFGFPYPTYPELIADNIKPVSGGNYLVDHYNWSQKGDGSSGSEVSNIWLFGYQAIRACNFVIEKAEQYRSQNPEKANDMMAQAYGIRAMMHFYLVNIFAQPYSYTTNADHTGIPYITIHDWTEPISTRNSVAEVYSNIVADLSSAISLFGNSTPNSLYMNKYAAKAFLSRAYLFKGDYVQAKNNAKEVGTAKPIMTGNNYPSKLYTTQETEALFQIPPESKSYYTQFAAAYYSPNYFLQFVATGDIAALLTENSNDKRKQWISWNAVKAVWQITKFPTGIVSSYPIPEASYYPTIIRSSEMYLTASEAYAKLNSEDSARFYLDAIRLRANPLATPTIATGAALMDSICKERRKELVFDGLRMFDLLRWKKGVNRIDAISPDAQNLSYPSNKAIAPLPQIDVKLGLLQNPSY